MPNSKKETHDITQTAVGQDAKHSSEENKIHEPGYDNDWKLFVMDRKVFTTLLKSFFISN